MSAVPAAQLEGLLPKRLELLQEFAHGTRVQNVLPGRVVVECRVMHVRQEPVRGELDASVSCCSQRFFPAKGRFRSDCLLLFSVLRRTGKRIFSAVNRMGWILTSTVIMNSRSVLRKSHLE